MFQSVQDQQVHCDHINIFMLFLILILNLFFTGVRDQHVHGDQDGVRRLQSWQACRGGDGQPYTGKGYY